MSAISIVALVLINLLFLLGCVLIGISLVRTLRQRLKRFRSLRQQDSLCREVQEAQAHLRHRLDLEAPVHPSRLEVLAAPETHPDHWLQVHPERP